MIQEKSYQEFIEILTKSLSKDNFISLRLAQKRNESNLAKLVLIKLVQLKKGTHLSFVYREPTQDITKNYLIQESIVTIKELLEKEYRQAELNTTQMDYFLTFFPNGKAKLRQKKSKQTKDISHSHDHIKNRMIDAKDNVYLLRLGVTTHDFKVRSKMNDKYKQINKYIEIIHDILKKTDLPKDLSIVDMGSGKGYLTFALYDYFKNIRDDDPLITGIEIREDLVAKCNKIASEVGYEGLEFQQGAIQDNELQKIDFLIALHACDTATDDAIYQGINAGSALIVCAPCCHKQVRKNMDTNGILASITNHGILKERQAEILTDTIRSMILEAYGYRTRVFEFVSGSNTPKNVMIVASLKEKRNTPDPKKIKDIQNLKDQYGISYHHLERLMGIENEFEVENSLRTEANK